jgi:hypothetical protein
MKKSLYILFLSVTFSFVTESFIYSQNNPEANFTDQSDIRIIKEVLEKFGDERKLDPGELMLRIGSYFLETPYVASTLEGNETEKLVINLREMDCTTFAENCLAFTRAIKKNKHDVSDFYDELRAIRYRQGIIDEYPSRLHYFSDWIFDNDKKKAIENVTKKLGGIAYHAKVNFMSEHPEKYPSLISNPEFIEKIRNQEKVNTARKFWYIPKNQVRKNAHQIKNGDIIGITTDIEGMDIMHVVISIWVKGKLKIMHASQSQKKVLISEETLAEYLSKRSNATGIMIARPRS